MEINWLWLILFGGLWFIQYLFKNQRESNASSSNNGFTATLQSESVRLSDGTPMNVLHVHISGQIVVPSDKHPCTIQVALWDVTDTDRRYPVITPLQDHQGPNHQFQVEHDITIPHQQSNIDSMQVCTIPLGFILAAKRGRRTIEVMVYIGPKGYPTNFYRRATVYFNYQEDSLGYTEVRDQAKNSEKAIAGLAVAFAAADGTIADVEIRSIMAFFTDRYTDSQEAQQISAAVDAEIRTVLDRLRSGKSDTLTEIAHHVDQLNAYASEPAKQAAYELCLMVVTVDEELATEEQSRLQELAQQLQLSSTFVKEVNDRYIRVTMYTESADASAVGMPAGLDREQQKTYLAEEYRKWRGRTTHKDAAIAAEAAIRLEKIAQLRAKLEDATS